MIDYTFAGANNPCIVIFIVRKGGRLIIGVEWTHCDLWFYSGALLKELKESQLKTKLFFKVPILIFLNSTYRTRLSEYSTSYI